MSEFYKAKPIKRFAAYVIDMILLLAITFGVMVPMCSWLGYANSREELVPFYEKYSQEYGIDLQISGTEYDELSEKQKEAYDKAYDAMNQDKEALYVMNKILFTVLASAAAGFLVGYAILEVALPLIFKNGQTIGKKAMKLCVMHKDHVLVSPWQVIFRAILGKYFIGTLIPMVLLALPELKIWIISGSFILAIIAMTQAFIVLMSQANCGIHDKLFNTVVADFEQQYIFDTLEERRAYDAELAAREEAYGQ